MRVAWHGSMQQDCAIARNVVNFDGERRRGKQTRLLEGLAEDDHFAVRGSKGMGHVRLATQTPEPG